MNFIFLDFYGFVHTELSTGDGYHLKCVAFFNDDFRFGISENLEAWFLDCKRLEGQGSTVQKTLMAKDPGEMNFSQPGTFELMVSFFPWVGHVNFQSLRWFTGKWHTRIGDSELGNRHFWVPC